MKKLKDCEHCDDCVPCGEGDFICIREEKPKVIIADYEPTEFYGRCILNKKKGVSCDE